MKDFNFKRFTVSKEAQEELTKYMDKCNITIHPEDDIVQQNKLMTETLVILYQFCVSLMVACKIFSIRNKSYT